MRQRRISLIALTVAALAAPPALARDMPAPPEFLASEADLRYEGRIGDMDVWRVPDLDTLFFSAPDGRTVIAGVAFSAGGRDIGAAISGLPPVRAFEVGAHEAPAADPVDIGEVSPPVALAPLDVPAMEELLALTEGTVAPSVTQPGLSFAGEMPAGYSGQEILRSTEDALREFTEEERRAVLVSLVERLQDADSPEAFVHGIMMWRVGIDEMRIARGLPPLYRMIPAEEAVEVRPEGSGAVAGEPTAGMSEAAPMTAWPGAGTPETGLDTGSDPLAAAIAEMRNVVDAAIAAVGEDDMTTEELLLDALRFEGFWFGLGRHEAPVVYAIIDPSCPYCARAMSNLRDVVVAGDLQLRILLAPLVSERAFGLIAGIMAAENPPLAFFEHSVDTARFGRSNLALGDYDAMPTVLQRGVMTNQEISRSFGVPGVPFFVFETEHGVETRSGVPVAEDFEGALPDPWNGNR